VRVMKCKCVWPLRLHRGRQCRWLPKKGGYVELTVMRTKFLLRALPHKGICVIGRYDPRHVDLVVVGLVEEWEFPRMAIKKRSAEVQQTNHLAAVETSILDACMPIVEHCCLRQYEDGSPREPGWVTIKTNGAAWAVQVKDPDTCCSFVAVAATLDKALETASLLLACDDAPWEMDQWLAKAKMEKKKK